MSDSTLPSCRSRPGITNSTDEFSIDAYEDKYRERVQQLIDARPDLVLFDEPLSNLDARLREQVRNELAELHHRHREPASFAFEPDLAAVLVIAALELHMVEHDEKIDLRHAAGKLSGS